MTPDHSLEIEHGRHHRPRIDRVMRVCKLCKQEVEDEFHFLIRCTTYATERNHLFHSISALYPNFVHLNDENKYIYLMSQENNDLWHRLGQQLVLRLKKRDDLLIDINA